MQIARILDAFKDLKNIRDKVKEDNNSQPARSKKQCENSRKESAKTQQESLLS